MPFARIEDAVAAIGRGEIVVVVDDEDRENEGDLIMAAEFATPEEIAFFLHHTSGVICAPVTHERARRARPAADGDRQHRDACAPRSRSASTTATAPPPASRPPTAPTTIRALVDPATRAADLLRARATSSRSRRARAACSSGRGTPRPPSTSPAWPACRRPACCARWSTTTKDDMARLPELERFAAEHGLLLISIADLIRYRRQTEKLVQRVGEARIPTQWGDFTCFAYESVLDGEQHVAFVRGAVQGQDDVLVRVHSECLTGDVFGSLRCDCGPQLHDGHGAHRRGGPRRGRLPAGPRGPRHRHRPQDAGLRAAGAGPRHRRRQPRARPARRQPRVRHRRADPGRPRHHHDAHCSPTTPPSTAASRASASRIVERVPLVIDAEPGEHRATCAPSASAWATCSRASTMCCDLRPAWGRPTGRDAATGGIGGRGSSPGRTPDGLDGAGLRVGVVWARFNDHDRRAPRSTASSAG